MLGIGFKQGSGVIYRKQAMKPTKTQKLIFFRIIKYAKDFCRYPHTTML
jgi:hypothetical protein